jgi:hypothetical protein
MGNCSRLQFPNKKQFIITIPKSLVLAKGWKKGDLLSFNISREGCLVLKKKQR